jgi:hypothetical protein
MSWLDDIIKSTEETESPERYYWWSGLAAIAAVVGRNVYLDRGGQYILYPNIYVALISARSGARKGNPIRLCTKVLEHCDVCRVFSGCQSIQALIQDLAQQVSFPNGNIATAQGIMISPEFATFLTEDKLSLKHLIDLFDTGAHKIWRKKLKDREPEILKEPCLTLLVASNESLWDTVVSKQDAEGGFVGRTFIIYERKRKLSNPLIYRTKSTPDIHELSLRLLKINKLQGEFTWTEGAANIYGPWYNDTLGHLIETTEDPTGTLDRMGDQVLKVAMLVSLARKDELTIEAEDMQLAINKCEECMQSVDEMMLDIVPNGNGDVSGHLKLVLRELSIAPDQTITRSRMLGRLQRKGIDAGILDRVIDTLHQSGAIVRPFRELGKHDLVYKMRKSVSAEFDKHLRDEVD